MTTPVGIALGSNLGNRQAELDAGIAFLRSLSTTGDVRQSSRIETDPVDCPPGSTCFLNAVAEIRLDSETLPPLVLLKELQAFERLRGRPSEHEINAPRLLDLDILYYGCLTVNTPELVIPHPQTHLRRFVLEPLAELRPDLILNGQKKSVREILSSLS